MRADKGGGAAGLALALALAAGLALAAAPAGALPIAGGSLGVEVTTAGLLDDLAGVQVTPGGTASLGPLGVLLLPIVGGDVDPAGVTGTLDLAGAEIQLQNQTSGQSMSVTLRSMVVDLTFGRVTGSLVWEGDGNTLLTLDAIPLFTLRSCAVSIASDPCLDAGGNPVDEGPLLAGIDWSGNAAQVLADALFEGTPLLRERDPFGLGFPVDVEFAAPEPGTAVLLVLGLAAGWLRRRAARGGL